MPGSQRQAHKNKKKKNIVKQPAQEEEEDDLDSETEEALYNAKPHNAGTMFKEAVKSTFCKANLTKMGIASLVGASLGAGLMVHKKFFLEKAEKEAAKEGIFKDYPALVDARTFCVELSKVHFLLCSQKSSGLDEKFKLMFERVLGLVNLVCKARASLTKKSVPHYQIDDVVQAAGDEVTELVAALQRAPYESFEIKYQLDLAAKAFEESLECYIGDTICDFYRCAKANILRSSIK